MTSELFRSGELSDGDQVPKVCKVTHLTGTTWGVTGGVSVLVRRAPDRDGKLTCTHEAKIAVLSPSLPPACGVAPAPAGSLRPGMRLTDPVSGLEVVCTRPGEGVLAYDGRPLLEISALPDSPLAWGKGDAGCWHP